MINTLWIAPVSCASLAAGYLLRKYYIERKRRSAHQSARHIIEEAQKQADTKRREAELEAKDRLYKARARSEKEARQKRQEIVRVEARLSQREQNLERRFDSVEKKEGELNSRSEELRKKETFLREELSGIIAKEREGLQKLSGLSVSEAKDLLLKRVEGDLREESAVILRRIEEETKQTAQKKAAEIISLAIQRCASEQVIETTASTVSLPNDEMKGRIIGREGRNIKSFETATGINIIIDDTPEAVTLSGFDPVRREIARLALERLVTDGRIHPGRIEEVVGKVSREMEVTTREEGEKAAFDIGILGLSQEEIKLLGRLKYRTSYGQNVLQHSREVAYLMGIMAVELGIDQKLAKRAGLLHDIGKAIDAETEGTHARIGADILKRNGEPESVLHAVLAHHEEVDAKTTLAVLLQASDAISASRPGVRRETLDTYVKRLERLEKIANSFEGIGKSYAIQAGREIRIMAQPEKISDAEAVNLAHEISKKIEKELSYPGQIKVTLIRETRAVDYAK